MPKHSEDSEGGPLHYFVREVSELWTPADSFGQHGLTLDAATAQIGADHAREMLLKHFVMIHKARTLVRKRPTKNL